MKKQTSTKKTLQMIVLTFEIVVVFLAGLTVFGLKLTTPPELALVLTGVLLLLVILTILLTAKTGDWLGSALHAIYFLPALVLPTIAILALIFGALWVFAIVKGNQIDKLRRAHLAAMQLG